MKPLKFLYSYFMKSLKISTELFTILLTWIVRAFGNLWNRICRAYPQLDTGPQIRFAPQIGDIKDMLVGLTCWQQYIWLDRHQVRSISEKFCSPFRNKLHPIFRHIRLWSRNWHYFLFVTRRSDSHAATVNGDIVASQNLAPSTVLYIQDGGWRSSWIYKNGHIFATDLPIDVLFCSRVGFSGTGELMVQLWNFKKSKMAVYTHCCRAQPLRQLGFLVIHPTH